MSWSFVDDVAGLIEAQAARTPDGIALRWYDGTAQMTYAELNERANALAWRLLACGVGAEVPVAVFVERSLDMVVAQLAVLKAGAICVPLETSYPAERLRSMIDDAEVRWALSPQRLFELPTLWLDGGREPRNPARERRPEAGVQIMFTSGSTGRPKGVTLTQAGLVNFLQAMQDRPGISARDTILALANYTFDPAMVEVYLPLTVGATSIIVPREVAVDGLRLHECVERWRPSILNATPASYRMLLEAGWTATPRWRPKAICGGETMTPQMAADLLARCSSVWNVYGPTEATALCALYEVRRPENPVPVGRAMPNMSLYVLDADGCEVQSGDIGELYIGGVCLSRGYLRRPDLTEAKFVNVRGERLYRSGDRARWRADGEIEVLGRTDDQLKLNGCRIEPGDVEAVLTQHAALAEAVVLAREVAAGTRVLVAYVTARPGTTPPLGRELRQWLAARLPDFMVPAAVVVLGEMPLNANAKVDRKALLGLPLELETEASEEAADEVETRLAALFAELLGVPRIGLSADFASLGLNSLLAVRLLRRIEGEFGQRVGPAQLLRARTIRQLAAVLRPPVAQPA
jgi:amino acid adenylation domain-containing protein